MRSLKSFWDIKEDLLDKKFLQKTFIKEIDNHIA